jgi:hypothetical protein
MDTDDWPQTISAGDRAALRAVLTWARGAGITNLRGRPRTWMAPDHTTMMLRIGGGVAIARPGRPVALISVGSVPETLSVLAALQLIPPCFSSLVQVR